MFSSKEAGLERSKLTLVQQGNDGIDLKRDNDKRYC